MPLPKTAVALTRRTLIAALPAAFFPVPGMAQTSRPANWAQPVAVPGVPNLHQITPLLYRSAQPTQDGFASLAALGIKTVISLRQTVNDIPLAAGTPIILQRIPMKSRYVAEKGGAKVVEAMRDLYAGLEVGPTLIHCHHGADRTGLIAALYRILTQGWSREAALQELIHGGFGYHPIWANIPRYIQSVDLTDLMDRIEA